MARSKSSDTDAIRQLAAKYAFAIDSRDLDTLSKLFVEPSHENIFVAPWVPSPGQQADVPVDIESTGPIDEQFRRALASFGPSFHMLGQHIIDLEGDEANGILYAVCTHALEPGPRWITVQLIYEDEYVFINDRWIFKKRDMHGLRAFESPPSVDSSDILPFGPVHDAPQCWSTWREFWAAESAADKKTEHC